MNVKAALIVLCGFLNGHMACAQGFAGLGSDAPGYALPDPATRFTFPKDHGMHPNFRIEWWYVTANLTDAEGIDYGIQWTLFRNALGPDAAADNQAWMGHAALSSPDRHFYAERLARGGTGQAGVSVTPFAAHIDEWQLSGDSLSSVELTAQGADFRYDLTLTTTHPFVPQGDQGYSVKSQSGQASHYYSQPFYTVAGTLTLEGRTVAVTGQGWLDREWSSQPLSTSQTGWDWVSLHLDSGAKLMGYRLRDTAAAPYVVGTWIDPDGTPHPLENGQLTMVPTRHALVENRSIPVAWEIALPGKSLAIQVEALRDQSWMATRIPYWEGPIAVTGTHGGIGYLEMSGYVPD